MEVGNRNNGVGLHPTKKEQRPLPSQSDLCIVGASKVEVIS
jgi:hypothetical protein